MLYKAGSDVAVRLDKVEIFLVLKLRHLGRLHHRPGDSQSVDSCLQVICQTALTPEDMIDIYAVAPINDK